MKTAAIAPSNTLLMWHSG